MSQRRRKGTLQPVSLKSQDEQGKRRFMEDFAKACRRMERDDTERAHMYPDSCLEEPFLSRREKAILNMEEKAQQDFGSLGLTSVFESFARTEIYSWRSVNEIDEHGDLGIAASIWILEEIRKAGKMAKLRPLLSAADSVHDFILPMDFSHPSFTESIIEAMYHLLAYRFEETPPDRQDAGMLLTPENFHHRRAQEQWQEILEMIPKEDIERAERMFRDTQWEIETRMMKTQAYYDRRIRKFCQDYDLPLEEDGLNEESLMALLAPSAQESVSERIPGSDRKEILNTIESAEGLVCYFDSYFFYGREYTRKNSGSSEIADLMSGVRVEDPYAVSFAAYALLDEDDDAPWLLHSASILLEQTLTMLPWYRNSADMDEEEMDDFFDGVPFNQGDWLHKEPDPKNTDFYHVKCGDKNLAQIVYEYSRSVVPMGPRPFDDRVPELVEKGLDETTAREVTNTAGLLFLPNYQAGMEWEKPLGPDFDDDDEEPFSDDDFGDNDEDIFPVSGYWADVAKAEGVEPPEHLGSDLDTAMEMADEIENLTAQLSGMRRENASLLAQLSDEKKKTKDLEESTKEELQTLRREHLELADLRELIFRQENQQEKEEVPEAETVAFPYKTKKRTVLFGGFEAFRKSLKPLLPDVKFVGVDQMNFDPDLVRNADVVWFQTNCLSHSQYYAVQRLARAAGVQMRYFTYQGALPCAEQLALADAKND